MNRRQQCAAHALPSALGWALVCSLAFVPVARAGGYLWLGSEYQGEGNIYRYNLTTGTIDKVVGHSGTDHWNNCATDGANLYLGNPTTQVLNRHDAGTGDLIQAGTYSATLAGHMEDGAFFEGSLWRATYSGGSLHRTTTAGVRETTFAAPSGLVGIEFVGNQAYCTNFGTGRIGRLERGLTAWTFVPAVWKAGEAPNGSLGALAFDPQSMTLYMTTGIGRLYSVTINGDTARATLVSDLLTLGYPSGGLPDGMGWTPATSVGVDPQRLPRQGSIELGNPSPNPASQGVWFDVRLAVSGHARVGIYDVSGRVLRGWNLPGLAAGQSRFHWDLRTSDGRRAPAGRYIVRLEANGETAARAFTRLE